MTYLNAEFIIIYDNDKTYYCGSGDIFHALDMAERLNGKVKQLIETVEHKNDVATIIDTNIMKVQ